MQRWVCGSEVGADQQRGVAGRRGRGLPGVLRTWIAREGKIAELEEFGGRTRQEQQELEEEQRRIQLCSHR